MLQALHRRARQYAPLVLVFWMMEKGVVPEYVRLANSMNSLIKIRVAKIVMITAKIMNAMVGGLRKTKLVAFNQE